MICVRTFINCLRDLALPLIASSVLVACASEAPRVSAEELAGHTEAQRVWLASLRHGMSVEEALGQAPPYRYYVFQYRENEKLFQYIQGRYPVTETLYALYFEDGRLASLLLGRSVTEADSYHFHLYERQDAWPLSGFEATAEWIRQRDRVGSDFREICGASLAADSAEDATAADVVQAAAHLPIALVAAPFAMPFLFFDSGGKERSEQRLAQVELGVTTSAQLVGLLGKPMSIWERQWGERWNYRVPDASFGLVDDTVVWGESNWWGTPVTRATPIGDCTSP